MFRIKTALLTSLLLVLCIGTAAAHTEKYSASMSSFGDFVSGHNAASVKQDMTNLANTTINALIGGSAFKSGSTLRKLRSAMLQNLATLKDLEKKQNLVTGTVDIMQDHLLKANNAIQENNFEEALDEVGFFQAELRKFNDFY